MVHISQATSPCGIPEELSWTRCVSSWLIVYSEAVGRSRKSGGMVQLFAIPWTDPLFFINPHITLCWWSSGKKEYTLAIFALKLLLKTCSAGFVKAMGTVEGAALLLLILSVRKLSTVYQILSSGGLDQAINPAISAASSLSWPAAVFSNVNRS